MNYLEQITDLIGQQNKRHAKKLSESLQGLDPLYHQRAEEFFKQYDAFASKQGRTLEYGVASYLKMVEGMIFEHMQFLRTGEYTCKSFKDAYERVYNNAELMEGYMHGLMLSQFLWAHHYQILTYFDRVLERYAAGIHSYLEVGGGHGLYFNEALRHVTDASAKFDLVDISESSVEMARQFISDSRARFFCEDIYEYHQAKGYDFITMGEVLEHVEEPVSLLKRLGELLADDGRVFITTPSNSPAIDHIYLFHSMDHVAEIIEQSGFEIVDRQCFPSENMSLEEAEKKKVTVMFAGVLQKKLR